MSHLSFILSFDQVRRLAKVIRPKYLLLACIGFVAAFLFTEFGLRLYLNATAPIEPVACKREDPIVHHAYMPNTTCRYKTAEWDTEIKINSLGLRNKEISEENNFRVLVLGDSFTAAESVDYEKSAVYLAEKRLNDEGKKVELVNTGVPSYSPILEYLWLREYGLKFMPDLVILNFDLGDISGENSLANFYSEEILEESLSLKSKVEESDLGSQDLHEEESTLESNESEPIEKITKEQPALWEDTRSPLFITRGENPGTLTLTSKIKFWLHTNLESYNFIAENIKKTIRKMRGIPEAPIYVLGDFKNDFEYVTRSSENANNRDVYKIPFENLKRIKRLLDKNGLPFVVIYFPHGHQISAKEWAKGRQFYGLELGKVYPLDSIKILMELSKEEKIEAYDASSAFLSAEESQFPLYYPFDGHFTANGNMIMANVIAEVIREKI